MAMRLMRVQAAIRFIRVMAIRFIRVMAIRFIRVMAIRLMVKAARVIRLIRVKDKGY
jgi:hypothetical protein